MMYEYLELRMNIRERSKALRSIKRNGSHVVQATDKNLGPCIMERTVYIHRALQDHLLNKLNYIEISQDIAVVVIK